MKLKGFIENSLLDWDGRISAVLFVPGCNYACPFCHNPELAKDSPSSGEFGLADVLPKLLSLQDWLDGVVVTGGEPCLAPGIENLLEELKSRGFSVKLDTNGSLPEKLDSILKKGLADYVAMDVKAPFDARRYARLAGCQADPELPRASAGLLRRSGIAHEFRTTVVPGWLSVEDLVEIASALGPEARYFLQRFRGGNTLDPALSALEPCGEDFLQQAAAACGRYVAGCAVRS